MPIRDQLLAIDNGTQSLRALVFDLRGKLIAKAKIPFPPYETPQPGWAEQDPERYWQALLQACKQLWQTPGVSKQRLAGMAVTTQRGSVINLDENGNPLRPAILWPDQRVAQRVPPIGLMWNTLFKLAGVSDTVAYLQANAESNWLRDQQPEVWQNTHKFVLISGFLNYRLTGSFVDATASQVAYLPFDYRNQNWAGERDWKWRALGLKPELLPDLSAPGAVLGTVTATAARLSGIPEGLPVIGAAADKACEVLGAGGISPEVGCLSYGTAGTINITTPKYLEIIPFLPPYPAALPGAFSPEVQIFRGYWMVEWFKQQFGHRERQLAQASGKSAEAHLEELIADIPPGCEGLMLQPYWSPGLRLPGPEARGTVMGFCDRHTRAHLYRAILEGLAYALREGKERIERKSGIPITDLRVSGRGTQSDTAMQITADVFGLPAARPHTYETSGLGAAILAAVGLGLHPDVRTAVTAMTATKMVFHPIESHRRMYDARFRRVYLKLYRRLKPLYRTLYKP